MVYQTIKGTWIYLNQTQEVLDSFYMNRGNDQIRSVPIDTIDNLVEKR